MQPPQSVLHVSTWTLTSLESEHRKPKEKIENEARRSEHNNAEQKNKETFANLASLLQSFEIGKDTGEDLIYFIEDDYLHFEPMLEEMVASYERIASQLNKDIFMCPSDYPYLYMNNEKTKI